VCSTRKHPRYPFVSRTICVDLFTVRIIIITSAPPFFSQPSLLKANDAVPCTPCGSLWTVVQVLVNRDTVALKAHVSAGFDLEVLGDCNEAFADICTSLGWRLPDK
jgi:hypothetical protein